MNESMVQWQSIGKKGGVEFYLIDSIEDFQEGAVFQVRESFVEGDKGIFYVLSKTHVERVGIETFTDLKRPTRPFGGPTAYFTCHESKKDNGIWLKRIDQNDPDQYFLDEECFDGFSWSWSVAMPDAIFS